MAKAEKKKNTFWETLKEVLKSNKDKKVFPWLQSGFLLLGFVLGVLVTTAVDLASRRIEFKKENVSELSKSEECATKGGRYDYRLEECILVTSDDGKECVKNEDCEGWCLAESSANIGESGMGKCSREFKPKGCIKYLDQGMVNEICL